MNILLGSMFSKLWNHGLIDADVLLWYVVFQTLFVKRIEQRSDFGIEQRSDF